MKTLTFIKPNGTEITINDQPANIDYAKISGWKLKGEDQSLETPVISKPPSTGVEMEIPAGVGTELYKSVEQKWGEFIIESDLFPNELVTKKLSEGWFKTKEEAENTPPDKSEGG